jgi:ankyrin repeat protein
MLGRTLFILVCSAGAAVAAEPSGDLSLVTAVKSHDATVTKKLLAERSVAVDASEGDGMTALHWAAYHDDVALVEALLSHGANANVATRYGITPLGLAVENGNPRMTASLLAAGADPNLDNGGQTALHIAARTNATQAGRLLLAKGAAVDARTDWQSVTPLMVAASAGASAMVEVLISAGGDVNAVAATTSLFIGPGDESTTYTQIPRGGMTPLMFAARDGCLECARLLLDAGAAVNYADPARVTPLNVAIYNAQYDVAALLIGRGADPNDDSVYLVVDMHNLVANGVNADNHPVPRTGSKTRNVEILASLLEHGAHPDHDLMKELQSRNLGFWRPGYLPGLTPLMRASQQADLEEMRVLLNAGANPSLAVRARTKGAGGYAVTTGGETALILAVRSWAGVPAGTLGNRPGKLAYRTRVPGDAAEAVSLLLAKGAEPNAADWAGNTALHHAAELGADALIELLASHGADAQAKNYDGATPLDLVLARRSRNAGQPGQPVSSPDVFAATEALLRRVMANDGPRGR